MQVDTVIGRVALVLAPGHHTWANCREAIQKLIDQKIDYGGQSLALVRTYDLFFDRVLHMAKFKCTVMAEEGPIMA